MLNFFIDLDSEPHQGTILSVKTLGLACASHSAVIVSHSVSGHPWSSRSLQGLCDVGMPPPACGFVQRPEPHCCPLTSLVCLTALRLLWTCLATVFICFFPCFRWPRSSCRRSVNRWEQVNRKRYRNLFFLPSGVRAIILASRE